MKRFCPSVEHLGMGKPDRDHPVRAEQAYMEALDAVWQSTVKAAVRGQHLHSEPEPIFFIALALLTA